jgi:hypothetical protein
MCAPEMKFYTIRIRERKINEKKKILIEVNILKTILCKNKNSLRHIFYKNRTVVGNVKKFYPNFIMAIERSILE